MCYEYDFIGHYWALVCNYFFDFAIINDDGTDFLKDITTFANYIFWKSQKTLTGMELGPILIFDGWTSFKG